MGFTYILSFLFVSCSLLLLFEMPLPPLSLICFPCFSLQFPIFLSKCNFSPLYFPIGCNSVFYHFLLQLLFGPTNFSRVPLFGLNNWIWLYFSLVSSSNTVSLELNVAFDKFFLCPIEIVIKESQIRLWRWAVGYSFHNQISKVCYISLIPSSNNVTSSELQITLNEIILCLVGTVNKWDQSIFEIKKWNF